MKTHRINTIKLRIQVALLAVMAFGQDSLRILARRLPSWKKTIAKVRPAEINSDFRIIRPPQVPFLDPFLQFGEVFRVGRHRKTQHV